MSQSKPYNIVVTRDVNVLDRLFFDSLGRTSFSERFGSLTTEEQSDSFLVSPNSRNGFISLEASFPSAGNSRYVVLKLIETNRFLEYFNIPTATVQESLIARARYNKSVLDPNKFIDKLKEGLRPQFFMSFGMGDDISKWSGPYNLKLADVSMNITGDGIREMELMFTPLTESLTMFTNKVNNDQLYSQNESIFDTNYLKDRRVEVSITRPFTKADPTNAEWNNDIRSVVRAFLSKCTPNKPSGNTLVLLPESNFDSKPKQPFQESKSKVNPTYQDWLKKYGIDLSTSEFISPKLSKDTTANESKSLDTNATNTIIQKTVDKSNSLSTEIIVRTSGGVASPELSLGQEKPKRDLFVPSSRFDEANYGKQIGIVESSPVSNNVPDSTAESENPDPLQYDLTMTAFIKDEEDPILSILKPIYKFIKQFNEVNKESALDDFVLFEENDTRILKLLKKYSLIEDSSNPVLIFGKKTYVYNLIYPTLSSITKRAVRRKFIEKVFNTAAPLTPTSPRSVFEGPFATAAWDSYGDDFIKLFGSKVGYRTSSFGESLGANSASIKELIGDSRNPLVFMSNVTNANVLNLTVDFSPYKEPLMGYSTESTYKLIDDTLGVEGVIKDDSFNTGLVGSILSIFLDKPPSKPDGTGTVLMETSSEDFISKGKKAVSTEAFRDVLKTYGGIKALEELDIDVFMEALLALSGKSVITEKVAPGDSGLVEVQNIKTLNKAIMRVSVKTLPFFDTLIIPGNEAVLYGKANNIQGATDLRNKFSQEDAFYTNTYQVISLKHMITADSAYSEFDLVRRDSDILSIQGGKFLDLFREAIKENVEEGERLDRIANKTASDKFVQDFLPQLFSFIPFQSDDELD